MAVEPGTTIARQCLLSCGRIGWLDRLNRLIKVLPLYLLPKRPFFFPKPRRPLDTIGFPAGLCTIRDSQFQAIKGRDRLARPCVELAQCLRQLLIDGTPPAACDVAAFLAARCATAFVRPASVTDEKT